MDSLGSFSSFLMAQAVVEEKDRGADFVIVTNRPRSKTKLRVIYTGLNLEQFLTSSPSNNSKVYSGGKIGAFNYGVDQLVEEHEVGNSPIVVQWLLP